MLHVEIYYYYYHYYYYIKKQQVTDIRHVGTPSGYLWFRIVDTHHGRGKSISSESYVYWNVHHLGS